MKVAILCYSAIGNTMLACRYMARKLGSVDVELFDITKDTRVELDKYGLVGFATFTDFWGPPYLMQKFVNGLPVQNGKPAFVFATHGGSPASMLKTFANAVSAKGFTIVGGHCLPAPESFPPAIARGRTSEDRPTDKDMAKFDEFIAELNKMIEDQVNGRTEFSPAKVKIGFLAKMAPALDRTRARKDMGGKFVDESLCNECGICKEACPYQAISLNPKPAFDEEKCYGCWACFNKCPTKAIYTAKLRGEGHYPRPSTRLRQKLEIT